VSLLEASALTVPLDPDTFVIRGIILAKTEPMPTSKESSMDAEQPMVFLSKTMHSREALRSMSRDGIGAELLVSLFFPKRQRLEPCVHNINRVSMRKAITVTRYDTIRKPDRLPCIY
jgi:hypothetical protein